MTPRRPVFGGVYGKPGRGKTFGLTRAFVADGFIVSPKRSVEPLLWTGLDMGPRLIERNDFTLVDTIKLVEGIKARRRKPTALVIDDVDMVIDMEVKQLKRSYAGWKTWEKLVERAYELRNAALEADCDVWLIFHEQDPRDVKTDDGRIKHLQGGPNIPGHQLVEKLPAMMQFIARVVWDPSVGGPWPWVYQTGPDELFTTKNRCSYASPPRFPQSLAELLRHGDRPVPYPRELPWMDKTVETIHHALLAEMDKETPEVADLLHRVSAKLGAKYDSRHVTWTLSDAWARTILVRAERNAADAWIDGMFRNSTTDPEEI